MKVKSLNHTYKVHQLYLFFFNDTATTEIYTLSLHDALPILTLNNRQLQLLPLSITEVHANGKKDRKSTRLNSSHGYISYAVFCLKKQQHNRTKTHFTRTDCQYCARGARHTQ